MAMRVSELMAVPSLDLRVVVDGDLERVIRWVHTTELADPTRYLQGGEVILTTGRLARRGHHEHRLRRARCARATSPRSATACPQPDAVVPRRPRRGLRRRAGCRSSRCRSRCRSSPSRARSSIASTASARRRCASGCCATTGSCTRPATAPALDGHPRRARPAPAGVDARPRPARDRGHAPRPATWPSCAPQATALGRSRSRWRRTAGWRSRSSPSAAPRPTSSSPPARPASPTTTAPPSTRRCRSSASSWPGCRRCARTSAGSRPSSST